MKRAAIAPMIAMIILILVIIASIIIGALYTCAILNADIPWWLKCYLLRN
jgi:hypothetical protein